MTDKEITVGLSIEEAGAIVNELQNQHGKCIAHNGAMKIKALLPPQPEQKPCAKCGGEGRVPIRKLADGQKASYIKYELCPACKGTGTGGEGVIYE